MVPGSVPYRRSAAAVAGFAALALVLLHDATLSGGALFRRDLAVVWYPMVEAFVRCVAAGAWPVWDPWRGFGQPLLADARAAVFYPPTWLNLVVAPWTYQTWFAFGHLVLGALGTRALARRLGGSSAGSLVAGAVWLASGPVASLAGQFHHLAGAAWMPVVLAAGLAALEAPGARNAGRLALALALQVFAGSPDYTAVTGLVLAVLALAHTARFRRPTGLGAVVGGAALALLLSAVQWLPTLFVARASGRWGASPEAANAWATAPLRLVEIVAPVPWPEMPAAVVALGLGDREPYLASIYCGALALMLGAAATAWRRPALLGLTIAAALLSLGPATLLYPTLIAVLPPLALLRYPEKLVVVTALGLALFAGLGFDALAGGRPEPRRRALAVALALFALVLVGCVALSAAPSAIVRVAALLLVAAAALHRRGAAPHARAALVAGLLVLDLLASHHRVNPTAPRALFAARPSPLAMLGAPEAARVYVYDYSLRFPPGGAERPGPERFTLARQPAGWSRDAALALGVFDYMLPPTAERWGVRGSFDGDIVALYPRPLARLVTLLREVEGRDAHTRLLQMGSVSHVLTLHDAAWSRELRPVALLPGSFREPIRVLGVPDPQPRAWVVGGVRGAGDDEAAARLLTAPEFDARSELVSTELPEAPARGVAAKMDVVRWQPDRIELGVLSAADGYLVLSEAFDPGWRATLDGAEVPVLRANLAFRAVPLPAGAHRLELRYRPRGLVAGGALSSAGAVLLALALLVRA